MQLTCGEYFLQSADDPRRPSALLSGPSLEAPGAAEWANLW